MQGRQTRLHRFRTAIALLLRIAAATVATGAVLSLAAKDAPAANQFVGSMVCKTCHPDVWFRFYRNAHFKSVASGKESPENTGCEGCHGPGKAHVQAHGGKATIVAFSQLAPKQILDACLRCHSQSLARANIRRSPHSLNDVACTQCHSIHKPATPKFLLAKSQPELCFGCHSNTRSDFSMPFKHPVDQGFMSLHRLSQSAWHISAYLANGRAALTGGSGFAQ